jgi:RNA polymerase-binding transcription factor DksA
MRKTDKLTRDERQEIEALILSEMDRLERTPGLFDSADEDLQSSAWGDSPVSDSAGTYSPSTLLQRVGQYQALTDALHRLHAGTYGHCIYCGNLIEAGRLLVIPETEHCRKCGNLS